jgi:hypothetical protein
MLGPFSFEQVVIDVVMSKEQVKGASENLV